MNGCPRLLFAIAFLILAVPTVGLAVEVKRVQSADSTIEEEWVRVTPDEDILGVGASRLSSSQHWEVFVNVSEFIRTEPLQSELHQEITQALLKLPGVTKVVHEDREVWSVMGDVSGKELIVACSEVLDTLRRKLQKAVSDLEPAT